VWPQSRARIPRCGLSRDDRRHQCLRRACPEPPAALDRRPEVEPGEDLAAVELVAGTLATVVRRGAGIQSVALLPDPDRQGAPGRRLLPAQRSLRSTTRARLGA